MTTLLIYIESTLIHVTRHWGNFLEEIMVLERHSESTG